MTFMSHGGVNLPKSFLRLLSIILVISLIIPPSALLAEQAGAIVQKWDEISSLRRNGEFDRAIELLGQIIQEHSDSEEILRHAYNELVFTLLLKGDDQGASKKAREAVLRFPELEADSIIFPERMNTMYGQLRRELYGSLSITKPEDSRIFLNKEFKGQTPLHIDLIRAGQYDLTVTKSGFHDYSEIISVEPNGKLNLELSMDRQRNKRWWLYRVGPAVLTGVLLAVGLSLTGGDEGEPVEQEPLPPPPPPPAR